MKQPVKPELDWHCAAELVFWLDRAYNKHCNICLQTTVQSLESHCSETVIMDVVIYREGRAQRNQALWFVPDRWLQFTFCTGRVYARAQRVVPRSQLSHMQTSSEEMAHKWLFLQHARNSLLLQNVNQLSSWILSKNNHPLLFFVVMPEAFPYGGSWRSILLISYKLASSEQKEVYFEEKSKLKRHFFSLEELFTPCIRLNQLAWSLGSC